MKIQLLRLLRRWEVFLTIFCVPFLLILDWYPILLYFILFYSTIRVLFYSQIDDDIACRPHYKGERNHFCQENIDVSNFLNLHSLGNHEAFCLAYVFTYRDFTGGTLGLAWVASASGKNRIYLVYSVRIIMKTPFIPAV